MADKNWEPDVTLDRYIYDYFMKRELHESAKAFMEEAKVAAEPVEIDAPGGFLYEWWSIMWDMYAARCNQKDSESAAAYLEAKERQAREYQQQIQVQQRQMLQQRNVPLLHRDPIIPSFGGPLGSKNSNEQPSATANVVARKIYEEHMKIPQSMGYLASTSVIDAGKMALLKSAANQQSQSLQCNGNAIGMSADLWKMECNKQLTNDIRPEGNLNGAQRPLPMDPAYVHRQAFMQSNSGSCVAVAGLNQGVPKMPLNGWPLTEPDRPQAQLLGHNNLNSKAQIMLGHSQAHGGLQNSSTFTDTNHHKFSGGPRRSASAKNEQSTKYDDASMRSPSQSSSPKMNVQHEQNASSQQPDHIQEQKLQNNKRKRPSSSGPATETGYGNTSNRSPNSSPSTQTPGVGATKTPNPQPANTPGNMMMYRREGSPGLLSSYDHLEDINNLADMDFLDDNVDSFLNNEEVQGRDNSQCSNAAEDRRV